MTRYDPETINELIGMLQDTEAGAALGDLLQAVRDLGYSRGWVDGEVGARERRAARDGLSEVIERLRNAHPMQPVYLTEEHNTARFKPNALVRYLLDAGPFTLNDLAVLPNIPREDHEQLAQLIGYSVSGFGDLSYANRDVVAAADKRVEKLVAKRKAAAHGS